MGGSCRGGERKSLVRIYFWPRKASKNTYLVYLIYLSDLKISTQALFCARRCTLARR